MIFLCTEDPFPSKRLDQLATAFRLKHSTNLKFEDHIYINHLTDTGQLQKCLLAELPYFLTTKNVGLIIVDSIAGIFRSDGQNVDYVKRSQEFLNICKALNRLQDCFNCAILIVNQVGSAFKYLTKNNLFTILSLLLNNKLSSGGMRRVTETPN